MSNVSIDISSRIRDSEFNLEDMIGIINYYHIHGELTMEERENLIAEARERATEALGVDPKTEIPALWIAVHDLQITVNNILSGTAETIEPADEFPEFVQPTGAHNAYNAGQGITFNGKHYRSLIDGNSWSPETYPAAWQEVE